VRSWSLCWLLVLLLSGCERPPQQPEPSLVVTVYQLGEPVVMGKRTAHGRVVPADLTQVSFQIPGKIASRAVEAGDRVRRGDVIATIEDSMHKQALADTRAQWQLSRRQLERAQRLYERDALTPAQRDELQAAFLLAEANLGLAEAKLSYTAIHAPFDGIVADVNKELYEAVIPGEAVVSVYRDDRIDVQVDIPDDLPAQFHRMPDRRGYPFEVVFSGIEQTYVMRYLKSSTARNPQTQAFEFWMTMPAEGLHIPPGLPVTVTADMAAMGMDTERGILVPLTALDATEQPGVFRVWRHRDGTVEPVVVNVARIYQEGALISGALAPGQRIVTSGLYRLSPGLAVVSKPAQQEP
jgi:RND family efflux transporter MFP subunit